ncbi:MAG TPA: hypothetical protein V6C97_01665 [Oculatellaceae cyanobacterium]
MRKRRIVSFSALSFSLLSIGLCSFSVHASEIPATNTKRIDEIVDFKQTNPKANFPGDGSDFCAPTALSDHLLWLGNHGYPKLVPAAADADATQISLIKTLASADFMGTDPATGTSPLQIMRALKKYVESCGYQVKSLSYEGFRPSAKPFETGVLTPDLSWLKSGSLAPKACLLNIGWYKWDEATDTYTRTGGHWVALVGYGVDAAGKPSPDTIIVHDPLPRFGTDKTNVYISLQKVTSGQLTGEYKGLPRDANGFYWYQSYTNGQKERSLANYGLIDGGIILELAAAE